MLLCHCSGNFPWLAPVVGLMVDRSVQQAAFKVLYEAVERIIQERRKEKGPTKVKLNDYIGRIYVFYA